MAVFFALNFVGCGISLFLKSGLGSDPIGVLCSGISDFFNIRYGYAALIYNLFVIAVALIDAKGDIGPGTVIYAVSIGFFVDLYRGLFGPLLPDSLKFIYKFLIYITGQMLFSAGLAVLISFRLGMNSLDAVLYRIKAATGISYSILRTGCDILYTIIGTVLGGAFGIGTSIGLFYSRF